MHPEHPGCSNCAPRSSWILVSRIIFTCNEWITIRFTAGEMSKTESISKTRSTNMYLWTQWHRRLWLNSYDPFLLSEKKVSIQLHSWATNLSPVAFRSAIDGLNISVEDYHLLVAGAPMMWCDNSHTKVPNLEIAAFIRPPAHLLLRNLHDPRLSGLWSLRLSRWHATSLDPCHNPRMKCWYLRAQCFSIDLAEGPRSHG